MEEKWIKHYSSRHPNIAGGRRRLLLRCVFGHSVRQRVEYRRNLSGLSRDLRTNAEMLQVKYSSLVLQNLAFLKHKGCTILHGVDACTNMRRHPDLKRKKFDRIVFNFPHAGFTRPEHDLYQIMLHQRVVWGFLRNAYSMLTEGLGQVHVTHKTSHPFSNWEIEKLGQRAWLVLIERAGFSRFEYPGYVNRKGDGRNSKKTFPVGMCCTYKFVKRYVVYDVED